MVVKPLSVTGKVTAIKPTEPVAAKSAVPEPVVDLSQWRSDTTSSGYMNVYKRKSGKFEAFSKSSRSKQYLGAYDTAEEAATVVARTTISKGSPLPATSGVTAANELVKPIEPVVTAPAKPEPVVDLSQWRSDTRNSGYEGVNWHKNRGKFEAWFGRKQYLGAYDTAEEAATVVARTTISRGSPLPATNGVTVDTNLPHIQRQALGQQE